jgi:branched-chain amino acid transport system substrate-binding protein
MSLPRFVRPLLQGCLLASFALVAQAQIKVGVVTSSTGPVALVGLPQKKSVPLLPTKVAGQTVQYISLDDGSDPTAAVSAFKKLINEDKVDAIIGPSGSPAAMGVIQFAAEAGVPMLAPVGTAAVVLPMNEQKKWVFKTTQNDEIIARALVQHMSQTKVKTVGFIGTADPYGENWAKVFGALAEKAASRWWPTSASSVRHLGDRPDAQADGRGARRHADRRAGQLAVLPSTTLYDVGYKGKVYQTHGAALPDFLRWAARRSKARSWPPARCWCSRGADSNPTKKVATEYVKAYEKLNGSKPATFGANVYDGPAAASRHPGGAEAGKPGTPPSAPRCAMRWSRPRSCRPPRASTT